MGKPSKSRGSGFPALDTFTYNNTPLSLTTPILSECKTPLERTIWIVDRLRVWQQNNLQKFLASNKVSGIRTDDARSISNLLQFLGGEATLDPKQILQARRGSRGRVGLDSP
jgi:hypothetical protein